MVSFGRGVYMDLLGYASMYNDKKDLVGVIQGKDSFFDTYE